MKQNGLSGKFLLLLAAVSIQALFSCKNNHSVQEQIQVEKFKIEFGTVSGCGWASLPIASVDGKDIDPEQSENPDIVFIMVEKGKKVNFRADILPINYVDRWEGVDKITGTEKETAELTVTKDTKVIMYIEAREYKLTFGADGEGGKLEAMVNGTPLTSPATVKGGEQIIFIATPEAGYKVESWTGDEVQITENTENKKASISVTKNLEVKVKFKKE